MGGLTVLVLGPNGMLGQEMKRVLVSHKDWTVHGTQRDQASVPFYLNAESSPDGWAPFFHRVHYDYVINCIGVLKSAIDENDPDSVRQAIVVNGLFPNCLAGITRATGTKVIHISTDGVFSGRSTRPYVESDPTDSPDVYGKSKALGECRALNVLNIRCSIIGRDRLRKKGLIEWVLGNPEGSEVSGFEDQMWNGVTTAQLAQLCAQILESGAFDGIREVSPIHHFCPNPAITKYELLSLVQQISGKNVAVRRTTSGNPGKSRILGSWFTELSRLYSENTKWPEVIRQTLGNPFE